MNDTSFYVTDKSKQDRIAEPFAKDRFSSTHALSRNGNPPVADSYRLRPTMRDSR
jgi:hypothetical protein